MSTKVFTGQGIDRAQVNTLTPTVISAGSGSFTVTIDLNTAVFLSTSADVLATVCAGIVAAVNSSTAPQFQEVTASTDDVLVYLTANTPGNPFTQTSSATGTSAALTTSTTTANKSVSDLSDATNFAGGVALANGDDLVVENTDKSILCGLDQSAVSLNSATFRETFTGTVGLPTENPNGYIDYRTTVLTFAAITTLKITHNSGDAAQRFRITVGANNCALTINGPLDNSSQNYGVVEWNGGSATHTVAVNNGSVAIAPDTSGSVTVSSLKAVDSAVLTGPNATVTTATLDGACSALFGKSPATLTMNGASTAQVQSGAGTTIDVDRGSMIWQGGAITTLTVGSTASMSFDEDRAAVTVTNCTIQYASSLFDNNKRVTWSNGIVLNKCGIEDVTLQLGKSFTLTPS